MGQDSDDYFVNDVSTCSPLYSELYNKCTSRGGGIGPADPASAGPKIN